MRIVRMGTTSTWKGKHIISTPANLIPKRCLTEKQNNLLTNKKTNKPYRRVK